MKTSSLLLFCLFCLSALLLSSCTTPANRRDLFSPTVTEGPYTKKLQGR